MASFWPLAGLFAYFGIALLFFAFSLREIARYRQGKPALAAVAALFWPVSLAAILIAVAAERRRSRKHPAARADDENEDR